MTQIRYNVTVAEHIPASVWGPEIRKTVVYSEVQSDMVRVIRELPRTDKILAISVVPFNPYVDSAGN